MNFLLILSKFYFAKKLRGEKRVVWTLVVLASLILSSYFLFSNLEDYRDDTTIVTLYDPQVLKLPPLY